MAGFGAKYPRFSKIKEEPTDALPVYEGAVSLGRLVKADLSVTLASGELCADDELAEKVSEFASGSLAMETDDIEDEAASVVYGAEAKDKEVRYKAGDTPPVGGVAYYKVLMRRGKKIFKGYFYPRAMASLGNDTAQSKSSSITFSTANTAFTVFRCNTDDWRITKEFDVEAEARAWVDEKLAPPAGGEG